MREYGDSANIAMARGLSLQGGLFGFALTLVSMLTLRLGPFEAAFTMVPLISIFIWPRGSSRGLSSVLIFMIGLVVDAASAGPPGLWALIYLGLYGALQPDRRQGQSRLRKLWPQFLVWLVITVVAVLLIGQLFISGRTAVWALLMQAVTAAILFPVFYSLRQGLRQLVGDSDNHGYAR